MSDPLEHLLSQIPASDAPESEIEAFMEKVVNTPGGSELIEDFAKKMTAGGSLDMMLKTEALREEERVLTSPARFIFRIELLRTTPLIWRRLSLPADCDYAHLSLAIQDAFGWEGSRPDRFEVWENGRLELSFDHGETETSFDQAGNKLLDIFQENVSEFRYFYGQEIYLRVGSQ